MYVSRRELIAGAGAVALCGGANAAVAVVPRGSFREKERDIPLDDWADVIVAGGGPAGIAAAVSAARAGKKVRLFELQGCLGGVWTAGLLSYIFDFNKSEIGWEIIRRLDALGARRLDSGVKYDLDRDWVYEPEYMKFVCEEMCREAGVRTILQCPVVAAYRDASGRNIETIVTESKSGRRAWRAKTFIDCTGDGDLAALAGCGFDYGYPGLDHGQPATMNALVAVDDGDAIAEYVSNEPAMWSRVKLPDGSTECHHIYASHKLKELLHKQGLDPSYGDPTLFRFHRNVFCFMANHEYKLRVDDAEAVSEATMRSRREIVALAAALEKLGGPWKGFRVIGTAEQIGHRDARRIHGRYTVTREDIEKGATFDDVCTVSRFGIDIHGIDKKMNDGKAAGNSGGVKFRPFQIPLRSCIAKDAAVMSGKSEADHWIEDAASFYQETNGVGKANYIQMPMISALMRGNDGTNASYTVEMFYKTRNTVRGTTAEQRQVLMKFDSSAYFNVLFRGNAYLFCVCKAGVEDHYDSGGKDTDDGKWHHVAVVVDGAAQKVSFYSDYRHEISQAGTLPDIGSTASILFGAKENGSGQWFDGWIDDIRVTRRALAPSEFLTTHPVGSGNASMLALFEQNYDFTCASNAAFNVTGVGEARTGGNAPTFVRESRGPLLLDGTNGTARATNEWSVRLNASRVVFPSVNFFEADAYTVEFWAKFDGIVDSSGAVDADSTSLSQNLPVMRLVRSDSTSEYDWYVFREKSNAAVIQMAIGGKYPAWNIPSGHFVDRKWHHYAFTFEPIDDGTKTFVKFFYDHANVEYEKDGAYVPGFTLGARLQKRIAGHNLMLGEGSNPQPNIVGEFDAVRVSKGVLDPSQFLARKPGGLLLFIR